MRRFLGNAASAARLVGDSPDLWIPGALAWLAFIGWLPFVLAVVPLPSAGDLAFFGADLYTSSRWPLNLVELLAGAASLALLASLLVALGEAVLLRRLSPTARARRLGDATRRVWLVHLIAALPGLAGVAVLLLAVAAVAPGEYQSPDIGGSLEVRIARDVAPAAAVLLLTILVGQTIGGWAVRRVLDHPDPLAEAVTPPRDVARWTRLSGLALLTLLVQVAALALAYLLLALLWGPISQQLGTGQLGGPHTLLLLVGFVAIWLCLLLGAGALHAWASAWWSLEEIGRA